MKVFSNFATIETVQFVIARLTQCTFNSKGEFIMNFFIDSYIDGNFKGKDETYILELSQVYDYWVVFCRNYSISYDNFIVKLAEFSFFKNI